MLPLTAAQMFGLSTALSIGQGFLSHRQALGAAQGQAAHNAMLGQINHQNALNVYDAYQNNFEALQSRLTQEHQAIGQQLVASQKAALETAGNLKAHGAASGFRGATLDQLMRQLAGQFSQGAQTHHKNAKTLGVQSYRQALGLYHEALSKANNVIPTSPVHTPSPWASALGIGGNLLNNYTMYSLAKRGAS